MNKFRGILCASLTGAAVLLGIVVSLPGKSNDRSRYSWERRQPAPPPTVSDPASIALLGTGLVALGIYAKKKNGKKS
jgi:hypothetical protein